MLPHVSFHQLFDVFRNPSLDRIPRNVSKLRARARRIEYTLTGKGRDLERVLAEVERWAHRWLPQPAKH